MTTSKQKLNNLSNTETNRQTHFNIFCLFNEKDDKEGGFGQGRRNFHFHVHHLLFDDKRILVVREVR